MQLLLTGAWKPGKTLYPTNARTLAAMVAKGWVEQRAQQEIEFRITDAGRHAFRQKLPEGPVRNRSRSG